MPGCQKVFPLEDRPCLGRKIVGLSGRGWPTDIEFDQESEPIIFFTTQTIGMLSTNVDTVLPSTLLKEDN